MNIHRNKNIEIITLVENTTNINELENRHGISFYIKTPLINILFDMGPDETFYNNSIKLGIDINNTNIAIISHGHNDHGGGLDTFLKHNDKAKIYIKKSAFEKHLSKHDSEFKDISINRSLINDNRICFSEDLETIYDKNDLKLTLFSNVKQEILIPESNSNLYKESNGKVTSDDFVHEQDLLINYAGTSILFTGCSHNGIINIVNKAKQINDGKDIDYVIGGFHLFSNRTKQYASPDFIKELGDELLKNITKFYTCHCTGEKAYFTLKERLKDNLHYMSTGSSLIIPIK